MQSFVIPNFHTYFDSLSLQFVLSMNLFNKKTEPPSAVRHSLYKMGKVIGSGTYGRVKRSQVKSTGELVAVKSMYKKDNTSENSKKVIKREIEILTNLKHKNIISLLDAFETSSKYYLVFELVTGSLFILMDRRRVV